MSEEGELKKAKWTSILYHIQDVHRDLPSLEIPECLHEELETDARAWLDPNTKAFTSLEKLVTEPRLLKDVAQLSSGDQTSSLEAWHSLLLQFAPKHTHFSWLGMRTRHELAAMHYNENGTKLQASTEEAKAPVFGGWMDGEVGP
nr:hypothetical protein BaRGS_007274 [Batillaria attramentaria]